MAAGRLINMLPITHFQKHQMTWLMVTILVSIFFVRQVSAANLVNPSSAPPGGQTSEPLTGSAAEQRKLGALIIGPTGASCAGNTNLCAQLCLNTDSIGTANKCIKNWSDIGGILSSSYVKLNLTAIANGGAATKQAGYVRLKGNAVATYPVTSRFSVYGGASPIGSYTALYADGLTLDNNAGYFIGTFGVEPTVNGALGRLCLNGTAATGSVDGYYCISQWSEVAITVSNKLTLQSFSGTPTNEQGNVGLGQAFNSASVILGDPNGLGFTFTCGDGMCNAGENSTVGSAQYCPIDCSTIKSVVGISASQVGGNVILNMQTGAAQEPSGSQVTVVVVRSDVANTTFRPMNGVNYARGGTTSFEIVGTATCAAGVSTGCSLTDSTVNSTNGLISGERYYYYSAFQGNLYPRYQSVAPASTVIQIDANGSPDDPPDDPPPILR